MTELDEIQQVAAKHYPISLEDYAVSVYESVGEITWLLRQAFENGWRSAEEGLEVTVAEAEQIVRLLNEGER